MSNLIFKDGGKLIFNLNFLVFFSFFYFLPSTLNNPEFKVPISTDVIGLSHHIEIDLY